MRVLLLALALAGCSSHAKDYGDLPQTRCTERWLLPTVVVAGKVASSR